MDTLQKILIVSITPYFIERENFWFEKNLKKILEARKTQIFWQENTLFLERDLKISLSFLLRKLDEMGYEKVWQVSQIGEFSQRGGIVDVFPINLNFAIRIEFLGNKIENIFKLPIEIKDEKREKEILKKKLKSQKIFSDLKGLKTGDYLVHLDHGIGIYNGQRTINKEQYYVLEYAQGDKLYVPFGLERKLSRYIGFSEPKISRLGTLTWIKTKKKIKEEAEKFARELLKVYAKREIVTRPPYLKSELAKYLKETFPFEETPDQEKAIEDIEKDLEKEKPMDRLVCGDVGFGKTEVALRAMVRVVESGYQAAMLCPTTILANQHYQNFKRRLKNLPVEIEILTRIQTKREQKETIKKLKEGKIDILVGTQRILSSDVEFKKLGLLVIDDEHKFGVRQKEKLKKLRAELDVLSLSATPIPRTLYLSLSGLREISLIQTPPPGRLPIKTFVLPFSERVIKEAIEKELKRGGQVYYLHNRVETIEIVKKFLEKLFNSHGRIRISRGFSRASAVRMPKFGIAHGRLNEKELVEVIENFQNKKIDVLVATTIIEAGLDLPNVNTLIVADSTKLGLSQAYQIRGRIGRSNIQAFAYFLYPQRLTPLAKERLKALKEAEELGCGYKIALKDLEIRGAGNILGREQSGNINRVGLNLYCQMLSEAIEKIKSPHPSLSHFN
jgi:transcription-repair coupling factor (superfamily II helicase)